ncbi:MAG TPA: arsenate reductase ArsC [Candidatus Dormibacteraeota bacterium]|nr:arsenate reductase ArsC [Candidatus Dormibacteraeota bacterium]
MTVHSAGAQRAGPVEASARKISVIFVCTGNSARSQMAEALLRHDAGDRFDVVSAGVSPRGVHPLTIAALDAVGIDISGAKSKPVGQFLGRRFDYVITLCDRARATCPVFPGGSDTLHWGLDDPAEATGTDAERRAAFDRTLREISGRLHAFIPLATAKVRA